MKKKLGMNGGTLIHAPLMEALTVSKLLGYDGYGVWSNQLLESYGVEDSMALSESIANSGFRIPEVVWLKPWLYLDGKEKEETYKEIEKLCILASKMKAEVICAPAYGVEGDFKLAVKNFRDFCDIAKQYNLKVGIEFVPIFKLNTLLSAYEVVDAAGSDNGGIVADTFHIFKGDTKLDDFNQVPVNKLHLVHLCDFVNQNKEGDFLHQARNQRNFPGEGVFDLPAFVRKMDEIGYNGVYSLEMLNESNKYRSLYDVAKKGLETSRLVLETVGELA